MIDITQPYSLIENLLIYTPKLKRLEISGSYFSFEQVAIFTKQIFILPQVKIFKLKLENGYFVSDCFKYLNTTMPNLKHFYFKKKILKSHNLFFNDVSITI